MGDMSDHQDGEHYSYNRSWADIETMLDKAEQRRNWVWMQAQRCDKHDRTFWLRQYKGLEGVINSIRWVLGDKDMTSNKVLGKVENDK